MAEDFWIVPGPRVEHYFNRVRAVAAWALPYLAKTNVQFCVKADLAHSANARVWAHTGHRGTETVCFARDAEDGLTAAEIVGISAHELGHLVAAKEQYPAHAEAMSGETIFGEDDEELQMEADIAAWKELGLDISYNSRDVQEIPLKELVRLEKERNLG